MDGASDFRDAEGVVVLPRKTQTGAIINPNAVLPGAVTLKRLQPISWKPVQIRQLHGGIQRRELLLTT
jgi:hypothetical protein